MKTSNYIVFRALKARFRINNSASPYSQTRPKKLWLVSMTAQSKVLRMKYAPNQQKTFHHNILFPIKEFQGEF